MDPVSNKGIGRPTPELTAGNERRKQELATEFEKIFALQLVDELTKDAFKTSDNPYSKAGGEMYRSHITETLASALAEQQSLGIARMLHQYWNNNEQNQP